MTSAARTGWCVFAVVAFLWSFAARKRLPMLPLGRASLWLRLHGVLGALAVALYWIHTRSLWPLGFYERGLAAAFYLTSVSGIAGHILQSVYPPLLTNSGMEVIFERIPEELAALRARAEALVLACAEETGSETLSRHYAESLDWYFRKPRFLLSHAFCGTQGHAWVQMGHVAVLGYLDDRERDYLKKLSHLAYDKNRLDFHYAAQGVMKGWLFLHIPLAAALATLILWHVLLVHVYAL